MSQFRRSHELESMKGVTTLSQSQRTNLKSKYGSITSKTNSGYHVGKMMEDFDIIQRNFRFKPDEIFPRIKISLLVSLICESAYLVTEEEASSDQVSTDDRETIEFSQMDVSGNKEHTTESRKQKNNIISPYLLLDVRDADQFRQSHIITAENYPKTVLSRANYETPALLSYRNHPDKIIVVYDEDELLAPQVATTLMERGYTNVYMLSGGLKVAKYCFPHSLVVMALGKSISIEVSKILATQLQQMSFRFRK